MRPIQSVLSTMEMQLPVLTPRSLVGSGTRYIALHVTAQAHQGSPAT